MDEDHARQDVVSPWTDKMERYPIYTSGRRFMRVSAYVSVGLVILLILILSRSNGRPLVHQLLPSVGTIKHERPGQEAHMIVDTDMSRRMDIGIWHTVDGVGQVNPQGSGKDKARPWPRPEGVTIYGLVFFGRRAPMSIAECYLRHNLVVNGGWLDEIHFVVNTHIPEDVAWLERLLGRVPQYKKIELETGTHHEDYQSLWRQALRPGNIYVKIDDDLVWLSRGSVEGVVSTLLDHPEALVVLSNLVNSAALGWVHNHQGAILSYLPELIPPPQSPSDAYGPHAWRASKLPTYTPPGGQKLEAYPLNEIDHDRPEDLGGPPHPHHRWLPLRDDALDLPITPMWGSQYSPYSADWSHWQHGAQQHYSFLDNLERGHLTPYYIGDPSNGIWNMRQMHSNVNFMAIRADDLLSNIPFHVQVDDEIYLTESLPSKLKRQTLVQSRSLAAHYTFSPQRAIEDTDILSRYRAYANEFVCAADNQVPVPLRAFNFTETASTSATNSDK